MNYLKLLNVVGILLFVYILLNLNLEMLAQALLKANWLLIAIALALLVPIILLKVVKWKVLLKAFRQELEFKTAFSFWINGSFLGQVTPGQIGELAKAKNVSKKLKISFTKALVPIIVERFFDIASLLILSIIGISLIYSKISIGPSLLLALAVFLAFLLLGILAISNKKIMGFFLKPFFIFFAKKKEEKKQEILEEFSKITQKMSENRKEMLAAFAISIIAWLITGFAGSLIAIALGINAPLIYLLFIPAIGSLVSLIPLSVLGVGTRDSAFIILLAAFSVSAELAVLFSISILIWNLIGVLPSAVIKTSN